MGIVRWYRNRRLKRDSSRTPAGLIPLSGIMSMAAVLDAESPDLRECEEAVRKFCRKNLIELDVLYVDFRKRAEGTPEHATITRKDLNIFGIPSTSKAGEMLGKSFDLFVCLSGSGRFCIEYLSKAVDAGMKAGVRRLPGDPYQITLIPSSECGRQPEGTSTEKFLTIRRILEKII